MPQQTGKLAAHSLGSQSRESGVICNNSGKLDNLGGVLENLCFLNYSLFSKQLRRYTCDSKRQLAQELLE